MKSRPANSSAVPAFTHRDAHCSVGHCLEEIAIVGENGSLLQTSQIYVAIGPTWWSAYLQWQHGSYPGKVFVNAEELNNMHCIMIIY